MDRPGDLPGLGAANTCGSRLTAKQGEALGHVLVSAVLAGLLFLTLVLWPTHRHHWRRTALAAAAIPMIYGGLVEGIQLLLPARGGSLFDLVLNAVGAIAGTAAALLLAASLSARKAWIGVGTATLLSIAAVPVWFLVDDPSLPWVGDHWHAQYTIRICGEDIPPLPGTHGAVHTHGDGLIHIHPFTPSDAGRNATLALFMQTTGGGLTNDSVTLPSGQTYVNGDTCPNNQQGYLTIWVNGDIPKEGSAYVPRDRDLVLVLFEPAS